MGRMRRLLIRPFTRGEGGQAAVEFAMGAAVLMTSMIGMMKVSLAIYTYHFIAEAAREGSRYAMVRGYSCSPTTGMTACPAAIDGSDVVTYVKGLSYPGISTSNMTVTSSYSVYPSGGTCTPSANCNNPGNLVTVKVQYAFPLAIPFRANSTINMQSTSKMIITQ
jgi:Flp pilus assembly protein TadG